MSAIPENDFLSLPYVYMSVVVYCSLNLRIHACNAQPASDDFQRPSIHNVHVTASLPSWINLTKDFLRLKNSNFNQHD